MFRYFACLLFLASSALGQSLLATVPEFDYPQAMAVNTFSDRVYVLQESANFVTEIDGLTNSAVKIPLPQVGQQSLNGAIAINQSTNKIYLVDGVNSEMSVLDGATLAITQVRVGNAPVAVAANPYTNKVYVANSSDNTVTVFDGNTSTTTTLNVGGEPWAISIDLERNKHRGRSFPHHDFRTADMDYLLSCQGIST